LLPMLWVNDVEKTTYYYKEVLQFTHGHFEPSVQWGYVIKDELEIMLAKFDRHMPEGGPLIYRFVISQYR